MDYLIDEVLSRQSEEVREFLMHTAVLERLCGPLCDTVAYASEAPGASQDILEYLEGANLFVVPLDTRREWYRYHHLFGDLLRHRLRRAGPGRIRELHLRASKWYEREGLVTEAVPHALAGEDPEWAAALIEPLAMALVTESRLATLLGWLDKLPENLVNARPWLCVARAWASLLSGQMEAVEPLLQCAEDILHDATPETYADQDRIYAHVTAIRAFVARWQGDNQRSIVLSHEALECLPEESLVARSALALNLGNAYLESGDIAAARPSYEGAIRTGRQAGSYYTALMALASIGMLQEMQGQLHEAAATYRQAIQLGTQWGGGKPLPATGLAFAMLGQLLYEWNDLHEALVHLTWGIELGEQADEVFIKLEGNLALARLKLGQGDAEGASDSLNRAQEIRSTAARAQETGKVSSLRARLWLAQGKQDVVGRWADERASHMGEELDYQSINEHLALARVFTTQGKATEALDLLARLLDVAETQGRMGEAIEMLALQALALQAQGDTDQAMTALERALKMAEPEGYVRTFVDEGPSMARLLYAGAERGITLEYTGRLLAAFPVAEPEMASLQDYEGEIIEPLSARELEVLQLIAGGQSNQEIAQELVLALATVKGHTRKIYGKLGVNSRMQAVVKARAFGILPPD
jgi:LuxR family maltose regulon positive regulatory protein